MPIRSLSSRTTTVFVCALLAGSTTNAFLPSTTTSHHRPLTAMDASSMPSMERPDQFFFTDDRTPQMTTPSSSTPTQVPKVAVVTKKSKAAGGGGGAVHKQGVFSPVVQVTKMALGDDTLNKLRAKVIGLHSEIIGNFVNTADSTIGNMVLRQLFHFADRDQSGTIDETELRAALLTLGFDWLQEKQIKGIFERADLDTNGAIDIDEWMAEAPRTLRTNLIKLAKKNGGDMGLLV